MRGSSRASLQVSSCGARAPEIAMGVRSGLTRRMIAWRTAGIPALLAALLSPVSNGAAAQTVDATTWLPDCRFGFLQGWRQASSRPLGGGRVGIDVVPPFPAMFSISVTAVHELDRATAGILGFDAGVRHRGSNIAPYLLLEGGVVVREGLPLDEGASVVGGKAGCDFRMNARTFLFLDATALRIGNDPEYYDHPDSHRVLLLTIGVALQFSGVHGSP